MAEEAQRGKKMPHNLTVSSGQDMSSDAEEFDCWKGNHKLFSRNLLVLLSRVMQPGVFWAAVVQVIAADRLT